MYAETLTSRADVAAQQERTYHIGIINNGLNVVCWKQTLWPSVPQRNLETAKATWKKNEQYSFKR